MRFHTLLLAVIVSLTSLAWVQEAPPSSQTPASPSGSAGQGQTRSQHRHEMMEMHKEQVEEMKTDVEQLKSSLAQMKANILTIKEPNELARWRNNVDMWDKLVSHMDRMVKHMESMGPDMMHEHGMGGPPSPPPAEKKPE
jgi:TolA-binding protein